MSKGVVMQKTHPMFLVAAAALTIFSLLGSAAITGLLPDLHPAHKSGNEKVLISPPGVNAGGVIMEKHPGQKIPPETDAYRSRVQPRQTSNDTPCSTCGTIISIQAVTLENNTDSHSPGESTHRGKSLLAAMGLINSDRQDTFESETKTMTAYVIRVRLHNGSYRTVTQYLQPEYMVGDQVRLESGALAISA